MSCNLIFKDGKLDRVVDNLGNLSQLYKEATTKFGEQDGLNVYLASKSKEFIDVFGENGEPTLQTVVNFIAENNKTQEELTNDHKSDIINLSISATPNFNLRDFVNSFYDNLGLFSISAKLKPFYSEYELRNLQNDVDLQTKVKNSVERLKNTQDVEELVLPSPSEKIEKTAEINSFGKLTNINPHTTTKQQIDEVVGLTRDEFDQLAYPEEIYVEAQKYQKAEVYMEVDGQIIPAKNNNTEIIIPLVVRESYNISMMQNIQGITARNIAVLQNSSEATSTILKAVEDDLILDGIDAIGLSEQPINEDLLIYLNTLNTFLISPNAQNVQQYAEVSDIFFERNVEPKTQAIKTDKTDREFVKLNTTLTEEEVYEQVGLLKVGNETYIKTSKEGLEDLYTNLRTYTEKFPQNKTLEEHIQEQIGTEAYRDFRNAENAEAIALYKMYFNVQQSSNYVAQFENVNFTGNINYLTNEYISDFYIESLKEKQKNSTKWKNFYSNFEVNEKGINLLNADEITARQVELYADENLRQYSLLSKQMPNLTTESYNISPTNMRDTMVNNPQILQPFEGEVSTLANNELIVKNTTKDFIKVGGEVFENLQSNGNLSIFTRVVAPLKEYNNYNIEQPITKTDLSEYKYLESQPNSFTSIKSYLSKKEKDDILGDKFAC